MMNGIIIKKVALPLIILLSLLMSACTNNKAGSYETLRFEEDLFSLIKDQNPDLNLLKEKYPQFFPIFCSEIIGIGPDTLAELPEYLNQFLTDPVIIKVHQLTDSVYPDLEQISKTIHQGIYRFNKMMLNEDTVKLVSYISGFNQSFVSLPGILGLGLDNYLGRETKFYEQLAIPAYVREGMEPSFLAVDAVRAWILSEIPEPPLMKTLIDHMIYEGKILYLLSESLPKTELHKILRYREDQLKWCEQNEKPMWEFILDNELLYSSDRLLISRLTKEAPFIREFGQESPGRAGSWLGFRIIQSYMKRTGKTAGDLIGAEDAKVIFSESKYRPG